MASVGEHLWKPGQSGNPLGKPKGTANKATSELKALARVYGPEAVEKLAKLMRGKDRHTMVLAKKLAEKLGESGISKEDRALMNKLLNVLEQRKPENELGAAKELLDRGYGKAPVAITGPDGESPAKILITREIVDPKLVEGEVVKVESMPSNGLTFRKPSDLP